MERKKEVQDESLRVIIWELVAQRKKKSHYTRPYCEEPFLKACSFAWLAGISEGCNDNSRIQEDVLYNKPKYQPETLHKVRGRDEFYIQVYCSFYIACLV